MFTNKEFRKTALTIFKHPYIKNRVNNSKNPIIEKIKILNELDLYYKMLFKYKQDLIIIKVVLFIYSIKWPERFKSNPAELIMYPLRYNGGRDIFDDFNKILRFLEIVDSDYTTPQVELKNYITDKSFGIKNDIFKRKISGLFIQEVFGSLDKIDMNNLNKENIYDLLKYEMKITEAIFSVCPPIYWWSEELIDIYVNTINDSGLLTLGYIKTHMVPGNPSISYYYVAHDHINEEILGISIRRFILFMSQQLLVKEGPQYPLTAWYFPGTTKVNTKKPIYISGPDKQIKKEIFLGPYTIIPFHYDFDTIDVRLLHSEDTTYYDQLFHDLYHCADYSGWDIWASKQY